MKPNFKYISNSLLLGSSLIAGSLASVSANENFTELQLAMVQTASNITAPLLNSELSAQKMLTMADSLYSQRMSKHQQELEFALVFTAANKGLAEAQFRLANFYMEGKLIVEDETEAAFWFEEAIAQGHNNAKYVYNNLFASYFDIGC